MLRLLVKAMAAGWTSRAVASPAPARQMQPSPSPSPGRSSWMQRPSIGEPDRLVHCATLRKQRRRGVRPASGRSQHGGGGMTGDRGRDWRRAAALAANGQGPRER
ncbi:hypothetical protein PMIN04_013248 [Paraphaeosphaeria minitans]